jgi:MYXO-CTERM domain-containing protein
MREPARLAACVAILTGCAAEPADVSVVESSLDISVFQLPPAPAAERAAIVHDYELLDPQNLVPRGLLEDAIAYFDLNQAHIPNTDYLTIVDLSLFSGKDRFWVVDLATGAVDAHKTAHGSGSDPEHDGYANTFSNVEGSLKSSLGFALTAEIYDGTHQHSMRLDGLSPEGSPNNMANTRMRERLIVVHEASYVSDQSTAKQGRSSGCPALDPDIEVAVVDKIHGGSLFYIATSSLNAPVGRVSCGDALCTGDETFESCPADCEGGADDPGTPDPIDPSTGEPTPEGGCSTGGGVGLGFALALLGLRRRRR